MDVIRRHAEEHAMDIAHCMLTMAKSELNLAGRRGLQRLIADVESGTADFEVILV
jgi:hypothetical protein